MSSDGSAFVGLSAAEADVLEIIHQSYEPDIDGTDEEYPRLDENQAAQAIVAFYRDRYGVDA